VKHRQLTYGHPVPQSFFDAFEEFISTLAPNFVLSIPQGSNNQVQIVAGSGNAQVGIGIDGLWRYIAAPINTQVTGPAGTYDLFVTCGDNNFVTNPSPPPPESDNTSYAFGLTAVTAGQTPTIGGGVTHYRRVGQVVTDGTRILALRQLLGEVDGQQLLQPGMIQSTAAATVPPGWLLCNGIAVSRVTYSALYAALGGPNSPWGQGDGSTTFNVPDLRGKVQVGAGAGPGLTSRSLAGVGGAETVTLTTAQIPAHSHGVSDPGHAHGLTINGAYTGVSVNGAPTGIYDSGHGHTQWGADTHWTYGGGSFNTPTVIGSWGGNDHGTAAVSAAIQDPWHAHGISDPSHGHGGSIAAAGTGVSTQNNGSGGSHENMPPWAAVTVIIKY
jgi:microcystin-dependent protein